MSAETCWRGRRGVWRCLLRANAASESPAFERAVNYGAYTGVLRQLIHLLKYERVRAAANPLGRFTAEACLQLEGDIDVAELLMIPVPVHKLRMRSRGFNQAELIARCRPARDRRVDWTAGDAGRDRAAAGALCRIAGGAECGRRGASRSAERSR